jgi:hypothetical protein
MAGAQEKSNNHIAKLLSVRIWPEQCKQGKAPIVSGLDRGDRVSLKPEWPKTRSSRQTIQELKLRVPRLEAGASLAVVAHATPETIGPEKLVADSFGEGRNQWKEADRD